LCRKENELYNENCDCKVCAERVCAKKVKVFLVRERAEKNVVDEWIWKQSGDAFTIYLACKQKVIMEPAVGQQSSCFWPSAYIGAS
jgi:hypothetical protein